VSDLAQRGHLGNGISRADINKAYAAARRAAGEADRKQAIAERNPFGKRLTEAEAARRKADEAEEALRALAPSPGASRERALVPSLTDAEIRAIDLAALEAEEAGRKQVVDPRHFRSPSIPIAARSPDRVAEMLPPPLARFLADMDVIRRQNRCAAILEKVGWETLETIGLSPVDIAERAEKAAAKYALHHPAETFNGPEHRRRRLAKTWRREMTKAARRARTYIAMAVGAVGGPERDGRPLYVADYAVACHRADMRQSRENMERLVIVKKEDPTAQIPMLDAHEKKKRREMAKRMLVSDVLLARARSIGARAIWITLTLEGDYHCNPTNAGHEVQKWNPMLGADEAMQRMQELYHQTVCLLRENGLRPWGFWDAQAQQDGTVHRHVLVFVHDRDMSEEDALAFADPLLSENDKAAIHTESDARVLAEARAVADGFWERFSSTPVALRQEESKRADRGCTAYVLGDIDPRYAPPKGRSGQHETPDTIVRYAARYSSRLAMGMGDGDEAAGGVPDDDAPATDLERHAVWARERDARLHTVTGMDSKRSPGKLWDSIWKAAERGEVPDDARMRLAVEQMALAQAALDEISGGRHSRPREGDEERPEMYGMGLRDRLQARCKAPFFRQEQVEDLEQQIRDANGRVATHAYQACVAAGLWSDRDLHVSERLWLRDALDLPPEDDLPFPPIPLRRERENAFGETVKETVGIAAPVVVAEGTAKERQAAVEVLEEGEMILTGEDGTWAIVKPSESSYDQILLRVEEWEVVDKATAEERVKEVRKREAEELLKEEKQRAAREDLQDALEALYEEQADSESDHADARFEDEETTFYGESREGLSDIPTDPRDRPCGPPHGDREPPG
jgi:hypothetical protein